MNHQQLWAAAPTPPIVGQIDHLVRRVRGISLAELAPLSLLDRTDTKFIVHHDQLLESLDAVIGEYVTLEISGVRPGRYATTYYDTDAFSMYYAHHGGERERYKLRCRTYLDSQMDFVEVKMKTNKERMVKYRRQLPGQPDTLDALDRNWLPANFPYDYSVLKPVVWNRFRRVTIASFERQERITLDVDITFGRGDETFAYDGLAVVELKQPKFSLTRSPLAQKLHQLHIQPQSISKFCVAATHFYPNFKRNTFKPLLLLLSRNFTFRGACERPV